MKLETIALILVLCAPAAAQDIMNQDIAVQVDDKGDASLDIQFQLSARGWIAWKNQYGDHPDLLKRDLGHRFSMYEMYDFAMTKDDVNRKATASLKLRAQARHKGGGKYEIVLPGDFKKIAESGRTWNFTATELLGQNALLNQSIKLVLPDGASAIKLGPVSDGQQIMSYDMPQGSGLTAWPILAGLGLLGVAVMTVLRFFILKRAL